MKNRNQNHETKTFSISLQEETVNRIQHVRKIAAQKNIDAYKDLDYKIFQWLIEQEKKMGITRNDHKTTIFCPKCSSKLHIVKTDKAEFLGCTNYPKCHYTKSVKG